MRDEQAVQNRKALESRDRMRQQKEMNKKFKLAGKELLNQGCREGE